MKINYLHPIRKTKGNLDENGNLVFDYTNDICKNISGSFDFAAIDNLNPDRGYYDDEYINVGKVKKDIDFEELNNRLQIHSVDKVMFKLIGDVSNKKILLLGNGTSLIELIFLFEGAQIVYTDISLQAVLTARNIFYNSSCYKFKNRIVFEAVNAMHLPYEKNSFDIIYGRAFAHHVSDLIPFLSEVYRCLKKDGQCFFLDGAYSRWWQFLKSTILRPLQLYSHWRTGISPEDKLATKKGGYRKEELSTIFSRIGLHSLLFYRVSFFEFLFQRASIKLIHPRLANRFTQLGKVLDNFLLTKKFLRNHGMHLVWGGKK